MTIERALKEYLLDCQIRKFTPRTIKTTRVNLNQFIVFCNELEIKETEDLSKSTIKQFTARLVSRGRKGTYINSILKHLKAFLTYCYNEEYTIDLTKKWDWVKEDKPVILAFTPDEVKQMLRKADGRDFIGVRDRAILTVLFETGIRCLELCTIKPEDIFDTYILVHGKNHKDRIVPITPVLAKALLRYNTVKENYFDLKSPQEYYFLSFHGKQLTNSAVEHIIKRYGSHITDKRVSPHTCRHFYAQQQIKMGTDLYTISRLLGHENIRITQTYLNSITDHDIIKHNINNSVLSNL